MKNSIKSLLNEAAGIQQYVTPLTYKTILGQIRSGDLAGAAKGISRIRRRHIKADYEKESERVKNNRSVATRSD